jgi:hypothetical protein
MELKLYHCASRLQQIKTKKISGPTHPRHHLKGKKSKKTKPAAEGKTPRA